MRWTPTSTRGTSTCNGRHCLARNYTNGPFYHRTLPQWCFFFSQHTALTLHHFHPAPTTAIASKNHQLLLERCKTTTKFYCTTSVSSPPHPRQRTLATTDLNLIHVKGHLPTRTERMNSTTMTTE
eukprot:1348932-Amphidinium_carterae.1